MSGTGDTPNDESGSAYGVRRLAAAVESWVGPGAGQREQAPALHRLRCAEEDAEAVHPAWIIVWAWS
jgi:hypothetical protein